MVESTAGSEEPAGLRDAVVVESIGRVAAKGKADADPQELVGRVRRQTDLPVAAKDGASPAAKEAAPQPGKINLDAVLQRRRA